MLKPAIAIALSVSIFVAPKEQVFARGINVDSLVDLEQAVARAKPGDQIVVANGSYVSNAPLMLATAGTKEQPIVITAEEIGGVEIHGNGGFRFSKPAAYLVIRGFLFRQKGQMDLAAGVHHCRITRNVFEQQVDGRARYLSVSGDENEIDHNTFRNKSTEGQMLQIQGPGDREMAQRTWIHHNYFHDFKNSRRNNSSALHIGHSARSMTPAYSVVEHNLFVRTQGENEGAICNKSSDNVYRFNTFGEDSSELSLRHGKRCLVYGNYFLGGNGIRFFSHDHRIYNNYFHDCRPAIAIGNGDATIPPGALTSHERPERVEIVYNTLVNNRENVQMAGRKNGLGATGLVFSNNIIVGGNKAVSIAGPLTDTAWQGNILWDNNGGAGDIPASGFIELDPKLEKNKQYPYRLDAASAAVGKGAGAFSYVKLDIDGQPRIETKDVGADQLSKQPSNNRILAPADVGPQGPLENRGWISSPTERIEWIVNPPAASNR